MKDMFEKKIYIKDYVIIAFDFAEVKRD